MGDDIHPIDDAEEIPGYTIVVALRILLCKFYCGIGELYS